MKLTTDQRKIGMKYNIVSIIVQDIQNKRYTELQQLYEALNFRDNNKLVAKLIQERNIGSFFTETIYYDILHVLADYIMDRPDVLALFESLYSKRYPGVEKVFTDIESQYKNNGFVSHVKNMKLSSKESHLFYYYVYKSEVFEEPEKIFKGFDYNRDSYMLDYGFYLSDKNLIDDQLVFCERGEESFEYIKNPNDKEYETVLNSSYFKRYLTKRRNELAEYLGVEEQKLAEYIHSIMKSQVDNTGAAQMRYGEVGLIETFTKNIIADNNGGTSWYNDMTGTFDSRESKRGISYIPDVDQLIENYYKSYVTTRYVEEIGKKNGFSKITLSRECIPKSIENDYQMILCMYEMQVLYKMFTLMQKQYYQDFSWEKITNQDFAKRYETIIANLKQIITEKDNQINNLAQKNEMLSIQITADKSRQTAPLVVENNKLIKQIEEKNSVIEDLKRQLQYQEEFIEALNKQDDEIQETTFNLEKLQSKRFLFVGHIKESIPELRHKFPNSSFMETETFSLTGVNVDAVVMLIKKMSHSMYYKIKSAGNLSEVKTIMCNTKNIDTILQRMYDELDL